MDRREHAGGAPNTGRSGDQWVPTCDFPYEVVDGFSYEEEKLYPMEKFTGALNSIAMWIINDGKFQGRGVTDRAMVFAWMIAPEAMGCATQAELAERMNLSRSQVNDYVKSFTQRFSFVCGATYTERQSECRKK
jgi:hypothetical protein|tara:strand:+ start:721 stop:1122 length:402 start_codon:yes stop_codon:yes gene_type:complete